MRFTKAGEIRDGHCHQFDHTTYVVRGGLRIDKLDKMGGKVIRSVEKRASDGHNWILIEAGVYHEITALEDNSIGHCIYAHRTPQGDVVQEYDGWQGAYQ